VGAPLILGRLFEVAYDLGILFVSGVPACLKASQFGKNGARQARPIAALHDSSR
jgi:hypothetical protein